jgi:tripeptidyl-peptidase-1
MNLRSGPSPSETEMDLFRSNPYSNRYGQHLSIDEVHDLFAPTEKSVHDVRSWLEAAGFSKDRISLSVNKQWIQFNADAEELEDLLHTKYYVYSHAETGRSHVACRE